MYDHHELKTACVVGELSHEPIYRMIKETKNGSKEDQKKRDAKRKDQHKKMSKSS